MGGVVLSGSVARYYPPSDLFRQAWQLSWASWYPFLADQALWPFTLCFPSSLEAQLFYLAEVGPISVRESGL